MFKVIPTQLYILQGAEELKFFRKKRNFDLLNTLLAFDTQENNILYSYALLHPFSFVLE